MLRSENSGAINTADFQLDPIAQRFFDQPSVELDELVPMSHVERRAMRATFVMLGVFAVALTAFLIYSRVIMPTPAELAGESLVAELPE